MPTCSLLVVLLFSIGPFPTTKVSYRFYNSQIWCTQISQDLIGLQLTCQRLFTFSSRGVRSILTLKTLKKKSKPFNSCDEGLCRYNSWGLADTNKIKPMVVLEHFEKAIVKPSKNIRVACLYLCRYKQQEMQKELLGKSKTLTLEEALDKGRKHEASVLHMKQLTEAQGSAKTDIYLIKKSQKRKCKICSGNHPWGKKLPIS